MYRQIPNQLTVLRLILAGVFFLTLNQYRFPAGPNLWLVVAFWVFILASITDWLDGWLARRWGAESTFGRVMDPFCDKVLVIGAFIYLAGPRFVMPDRPPHAVLSLNMISGVYPWMVAVILARELLVTGIRDELEGRGLRFGAQWSGKLKAVLQLVTVPVILFIIWCNPLTPGREWMAWVRDGFMYATVAITVISGAPYVTSSWRALRPARHEETTGK